MKNYSYIAKNYIFHPNTNSKINQIKINAIKQYNSHNYNKHKTLSKNNIYKDKKISKKLIGNLNSSPNNLKCNDLIYESKAQINNKEFNTKKSTNKDYLLSVKAKRVNSTNNLQNNNINKSNSNKKYNKPNRSNSNISSNKNSNKKTSINNSNKKKYKFKKIDLTTDNKNYQSYQLTINNTNFKDEQSKSHYNIYKTKDNRQNSKIKNTFFNQYNFPNTPLKIIPGNKNSYLNHYTDNSDNIGSLFNNNGLKNIITEFNKSNINNKAIKYYQLLENIIGKSENQDTRQIFQLLLNEFIEINREYLNTVKYYKETINKLNEKLNEKILQIQKNNFEFSKNFENYKRNLECSKEFGNSQNYIDDSHKLLEFLKLRNYELDEENLFHKENENNLSCFLPKKNKFFFDLNKDNLNDLDALYFFDKINMDAVGNKNNSFYCSNNKFTTNKNKMHNYLTNNGDVIPQINLDHDYIKNCIKNCQQNEAKKIAEKNLNTFQRIVLEFKKF